MSMPLRGGIWLALLMLRPVACLVTTLSSSSALNTATTRSAVAVMQYGQQQQYGGQQMGGQQMGGQQSQWRVDAVVGVTGMPQQRFPSKPKFWTMPYFVSNGENQILGRWNLMQPSPYVSRCQAMVKVLPDGTPILIGCGKNPCYWRSQNGMWNYLYRRQTVTLENGLQISLDCANPEAAIVTCTVANGMQPGGMQGGFQQQGGMQQMGYPPQQGGGGYPQQQQGGGYGY